MGYGLMGTGGEPSLLINSASNYRAPTVCSAQMTKVVPAVGEHTVWGDGKVEAQRRALLPSLGHQ